MDWNALEIIDISQPIGEGSAVFPGDTPFSRQVTLSYPESQLFNLTAFTMSPHVGTHADAPIHIHGDMDLGDASFASEMPLAPFFGPAVVLDLAPWDEAITPDHIKTQLEGLKSLPERVLFKTSRHIRHTVFEDRYAYFSVALVQLMADMGVRLMGIDTPSVDHIESKTLDAHHSLLQHRLVWLENLDLTQVEPGGYILCALPLKFTQLEASPVLAVLLRP